MRAHGLDHIVLCVADVAASCGFYERVLGMEAREERPGKWSLHFGASKISLQDARTAPALARRTVPGSGNFCVLTDMPMDAVVEHLLREGVDIVEGPDRRAGATGAILSVYFRDPDGNLVEVSSLIGSPARDR
jgi:catechol 2,3-dioxygenase-like lactoylglutathione lyase family enzyme